LSIEKNRFVSLNDSYVYCCVIKSNGFSEISYIKSHNFQENDFLIIITKDQCYYSRIDPPLFTKENELQKYKRYFFNSKEGLKAITSGYPSSQNVFLLWTEDTFKKSFIRTIDFNQKIFSLLKNKDDFISFPILSSQPNICKFLFEVSNLLIGKI
jgi:hypothetical protein